ncbi:MAG TPA: MaoC/PaaZ C-terminal domain-containing protein [Candidatus Binatia bacterium]|jgi:acyl dehydratase|nr:MaoC/PaaZ C-terminal domain-containing protein [Candidatus Binatia bacterium]
MSSIYFEDVEEGDELPGLDLFLSKDQVRQYARTAGMYVPRFTDDDGARAEGLPGMIAPGVMSMGLLARMISDWNLAAQITRIGTTFRSPVLPDRNIHLRGAVTQKNEPDHTAECDIWIENDDGERWVIGTVTVALPTKA